MNINNNTIIKRLAAMLAIGCLLLLASPAVSAANRTVNSGTVIESGSTYESISTAAALAVSNNLTYYSGTNLTLNSTDTNRQGILVQTGGVAFLTGGSITTTGTAALGAFSSSAALTLDNVDISTSGSAANGVRVSYEGGTLTMNGGTIATTGRDAIGAFATATGALTLNNVVINTEGVNAYGVQTQTASILTMTGGTITTTGTGAAGVYALGASAMTLSDVAINTGGASNYGMRVQGAATVSMSGGTIVTTGSATVGVYSSDAGTTIILNDVHVRTEGAGASYGMRTNTLGSLSMTGGAIITAGAGAAGIYVSATSKTTLTDVSITTGGLAAYGVQALTSSTVTVTGGSVATTGSAAHAITSDNLGSAVTVDNAHVQTEGMNAYGVRANALGSLSMTGGAITTTGTGGVGAYASGTARMALSDVSITTTGASNAFGVRATSSSTVTITGGTINTTNAGATGIYADTASVMTLSNVSINTELGSAFGVRVLSSSTVTVTGGTITTKGYAGQGVVAENAGARVILDDVYIKTTGNASNGLRLLNGASLSGTDLDIHTTGLNEAAVMLLNGGTASITGLTIQTVGSAAPGISISGSTGPSHYLQVVSGTVRTAGVGSYGVNIVRGAAFSGTAVFDNVSITSENADGIRISPVGDPATFTGTSWELVLRNGSTVTGTQSALAVTGSLSSDAASPFTVKVGLADRSALIGDVTVNDITILRLDLTGTSTIQGDVVQNGSAVVNATLSNGSTGVGGFTGESLTIDGLSAWTFTKASNIKNGSNAGILNIGDQNVEFTNLTNTGTVVINVNTDTGSHGSLIVATASGSGAVHIETSGGGGENPKTVLPGVVVGAGTENWTWDPIEWGLKEVQVTPNADGSLSIIQTGESPMGVVLKSSVAIQQAMWFAQQDSLLKRFGDLRVEAASSRVSDKSRDVTSALWLRAYGQKLNVDSDIAGRAYGQLSYGADVGADKAWALDNDGTLFAGIYIGTAVSDIDYETAGADAELTSTHGGVYLTWLRQNGFYMDAAIKVANIDSTLKTPNEDTADYGNLNAGLTFEIGKKYRISSDWFADSSLQVGYLHIFAKNYTTTGKQTTTAITAKDMDAFQVRLTQRFGKTIRLAGGGVLQPYMKFGRSLLDGNGGEISDGHSAIRANVDGERWEIGAGMAWRVGRFALLLDYEASYGRKYAQPWGLTAAYAYRF